MTGHDAFHEESLRLAMRRVPVLGSDSALIEAWAADYRRTASRGLNAAELYAAERHMARVTARLLWRETPHSTWAALTRRALAPMMNVRR